jgi:asparagine synthase (glutamine-hydrolysing)
MSAILGLLYRDGRPVDRAVLGRMHAALAHRGPDGGGLWQSGSVGLGHQLLHTTPESVYEWQPLKLHRPALVEARVEPRGAVPSLVAVADARLDNRTELLATLDVRTADRATVTDADLILAAYARWGEACATYLLGDFSFAIWDVQRQRIMGARDHAGVKPFVYAVTDQVIAFASEGKALLQLPEVPRRPDETTIADFLLGEPDDQAATFYQAVRRLPPGHVFIADTARVEVRPYWALDPTRELSLPSDAAYAEAFREIFTEAVRARLRSLRPAGAMLSGGLDSSSIVCVAGALQRDADTQLLPTFTCTYGSVPACDEREYRQLALRAGPASSVTLPADDISPLSHLDDLIVQAEGPPFGPGLASQIALYRLVRTHGVGVLLDGHGGDEAVSHGEGYLSELALRRRWPTLIREVRGVARTYDEPAWPMMAAYVRYGLSASPAFRTAWRAGGAAWHALRRTDRQTPGSPPSFGVIQPALAARVQLADRIEARRRAQSRAIRRERTFHHRILTDGRQALGLEVLDRLAAAAGVEPRYPFWDRRLVEFCLALPPEQKLRDGWPRSILRRAMQGILPPAIQWRTDKTDFTPALARGLQTFEREYLDRALFSEMPELDAYIDRAALRRRYERWLTTWSANAHGDLHDIWRAVTLARWLQLANDGPDRSAAPAPASATRTSSEPPSTPSNGVFSQGLPAG